MHNLTKKFLTKLIPVWFFVGALSMALVFRQVITNAPSEIGHHPMVDTWLRIGLLIFVGLLGASLVWIKNETVRLNIAVGLLSLFFTVTVMLVLKNSFYALGGVNGDQSFRTAYITKFANFSGLIDFTYHGLPSFYPPLYYFLLGKLSLLLQTPPYVMSKYGLMMTVFFLPYITFGLWSLIVGQKKAVVITYVMVLLPVWYKPSGWIALYLFVPWWLFFIVGISGKPINRKWWYFITGGILGSIIFQTFYFLFLVGGMSLILDYVFKKFFVRQTSVSLNHYVNPLIMLIITALLSSYYWFPFLRSMYTTGGWEQYQGLDYSAGNAAIDFSFFTFSITGIVALCGLVYLLITYKSEKLSYQLLMLEISAYLILILNFIGAVIERPFKGNNAMTLGSYVLFISAFILLYTLWQDRFWDRICTEHGKTIFYVFLILLFIFVGQELVDTLASSSLVENALNTKYPELLIKAFSEMSGENYSGKVVLADGSYQELAVYLPVFEFISWNIHYSHPAGLYRERVDFLDKLSQVENPALFAGFLMNNRYSKIDYILLVPEEEAYRMKYSDHDFPNQPDTKFLNFPKELFSEQYFIKRVYRNYELFIPIYENDPMHNDWENVDIEGFNSIIDDFAAHLENSDFDS